MIKFKLDDDGKCRVTEFTDPIIGTSSYDGSMLGFGFRDGDDDFHEAMKTEGGWLVSPAELRAIVKLLAKLSREGAIKRVINRIKFW